MYKLLCVYIVIYLCKYVIYPLVEVYRQIFDYVHTRMYSLIVCGHLVLLILDLAGRKGQKNVQSNAVLSFKCCS